MDNFLVQTVHNDTGIHYKLRLQDVPAPAFTYINDLLNICPDPRTLASWIHTVLHHKQSLMPLKSPPNAKSKRGGSRKPPSPSTSGQLKRRYACHNCGETCGARKEFQRHMGEKCELLCLWRCPDCHKPYHRGYHLRDHHKKHHGGCNDANCTHLANAKQPVPPKTVFGCGYCIKSFNKVKDFISHLIKHFEEDFDEPQWTHNRKIKSILHHPRYQTTWTNLCSSRFNTLACYWPEMTWELEDVEKEVHDLQYGISGPYLPVCLEGLLEKRLENVRPASPTSSFATGTTLATYPSFEDTFMGDARMDCSYDPRNGTELTTVGDFAVAENVVGSVADYMVDESPSTLVNTDDIWSNSTSQSADVGGLQLASNSISEFKDFIPAFGPTRDIDTGFMGLDQFETIADYMHFDTDFNLFGFTNKQFAAVPQTLTDNIEDVLMDSIPTSHPAMVYDMNNNAYNTSGTVSTVAPMHTLRDVSTTPMFQYNTGSKSTSPFNPTPPLPKQHSHKRSISGRILRAIQNYPIITPMC